jgi:predicted AlkP superfamily phosphohydrolase/phosphomutase
VQYFPQNYGIRHDTVQGAYDFQAKPPFYALGDNYRVATFDIPVSALVDEVNGVQVLGWGGHAPHTPSHSAPPERLPEIIQRYGKNPLLHKDYGNWWDQAYRDRIECSLKVSIENRVLICKELIQQADWDLFITVFGETHTAGHNFWHLSQKDNPLHPAQGDGADPLLDTFQRIDQGIGELVAAMPAAQVVVFAVHGMGNNVTDMFSMTFLPELLYRYSFPGSYAIAHGHTHPRPRGINFTPRRKSWSGEVWQKRYDSNPLKRWLMPWIPSKFDHYLQADAKPGLMSPYVLRQQKADLNWMPALWYRHLWPQMKAFALPAFAAGHIRINLKHRDGQGRVEPDHYEAVCDEITTHLQALKDGRTGAAIVAKVVRTRNADNCLSNDPTLPDADLVVLWADTPSDVVDSPTFGRIGPLTYYRTGGHRSDGFVMIKSPTVPAGHRFTNAQTIDIGPTIQQLLGADVSPGMDGKTLLKAKTGPLIEEDHAY